MIQKFNFFDQQERPNVWLCNPDKKRIQFIRDCTDSQVILRFNEMSEIKFQVSSFDDGYDKFVSKRLIEVENIGFFIINNVTENNNGIEKYKEITAYQLEAELQYKKIILFDGTYKFYDPLDNEKTLLGQIFDGQNGWTVKHVDADLANSYRTFEVPDSTIYSFLMNEVETAYECLFVFDSNDRTVSAYYLPNYLKKTDIYLTFQNLIKETDIQEEQEEIVTALKVYGSNINIRGVNPTGSDTIYDFSYFKNTDWMQQELIDALNKWEQKVKDRKEEYKQQLLAKKNANRELVTLKSDLVQLKEDYDSLEGVMAVRVKAGTDFSDIKQQMDAKQLEINAKEQQIQNKETQIQSLTNQLSDISKGLSLESNITGDLWIELIPYIIQNTYQNDTFLSTSIMTEEQIQTQQEELLEMGYNVLSRVAHPRYTFQLDTVNFLNLKPFEQFTKELELGAILNIQNDEELIKPILLEVEYSFDDPTILNLTFGNRYKLDSAEYEFAELFGDAISAGTSVKFDSAKWGEYVNSGMNNEVSNFINGSLDAAKNNVINAKNQELLINQNGLRGRTKKDDGSYKDEQCWLTQDTLAFTRDNWNTAALALGRLKAPNEDADYYGLSAEVLVGKILAGNQLIITNENNSFTLDSSGAVLNNASFTIKTNNNTIKLDPTSGIEVLKGNEKQMYLDPQTGDLKIAGNVAANSGSIGGWEITENGLSDTHGNEINSDGTGKLGLMSWSGNTARFDGNIYAKNIGGQYTEWPSLNQELVNIRNLFADYATIGNLNATNGRIDSLNATVANLGSIYATKAEFNSLNANKANINDLKIGGTKASGQTTSVCTSSKQFKYYFCGTGAKINAYKRKVVTGVDFKNKTVTTADVIYSATLDRDSTPITIKDPVFGAITYLGLRPG